MHLVAPDRITIIAADPHQGYRFSVGCFTLGQTTVDLADQLAIRVDIAEISDSRTRNRLASPQLEYEIFTNIRENSRAPVVISSISIAEIVLEARRHYTELGYYRADINRIVVPTEAPYRLAVRIEHLLYSLKDARSFAFANSLNPPLREAGAALALSRAVNFGVVSYVVLPPDPMLAAKYLHILLARETIPLTYLAGILTTTSAAYASLDIVL